MRNAIRASGLAICIVVFAAGVVPSASAVTVHECKEATGTGVRYTDSTCATESGTGKFQTVPIPVGTPTGLTFTATSNIVLAATIAGVKFEITCTGGSGSGTATNTEAAGAMKVVGSEGHISFEGCSVTAPAGKGCTVPSTLTTNTVKSETTEMKDVITPETGTTFITITVSGCTVTALNGSKTVTGSASGINNTGTTTEFTTTSGSALTFGGQAATIIGKTHSKVAETGAQVGLETP